MLEGCAAPNADASSGYLVSHETTEEFRHPHLTHHHHSHHGHQGKSWHDPPALGQLATQLAGGTKEAEASAGQALLLTWERSVRNVGQAQFLNPDPYFRTFVDAHLNVCPRSVGNEDHDGVARRSISCAQYGS